MHLGFRMTATMPTFSSHPCHVISQNGKASWCTIDGTAQIRANVAKGWYAGVTWPGAKRRAGTATGLPRARSRSRIGGVRKLTMDMAANSKSGHELQNDLRPS